MLKHFSDMVDYRVVHTPWDHYRSGWSYAKSLLSDHFKNGPITLYSSIEWQFDDPDFDVGWPLEPKPTCKYAGIVHGHPQKISNFLQSDWYKTTSHLCVGLYCLSSCLAIDPNIKKTVYVPFTSPSCFWNYDHFIMHKQYITIGNAYRNVEFVMSTGLINRKFHNYRHSPSRLSDHDYDKLLAASVVILNIFDEAVVNSVLDCMAGYVPLLVNRTRTLEEYLGVNYPLFYNDLNDCVRKANDMKLLLDAHVYLKSKDNTRHTGEYFINSIMSGIR